MFTIAITGHRKLLNEDDVRREIALCLAYFKTQNTPIQTISALATGADTIFAQEAQKAGIPLRIMLPFALADYQQDFDEADLAQLDAELVLRNHKYEVVAPLKTHTNEERNEAYLATGKKMVDEADVLIAVWDGQPTDRKGGTSDIVQYAQKQGKELHIIKGIQETTPEEEIQSIFTRLDAKAIKYKKQCFEPIWKVGLAFAVVAVLFFAVGLSFHDHLTEVERFILAMLEGGFILISAWALLVVAKNWKTQFLIFRRNAEYLRSIIWYEEAGIPIPLVEKSKYSQLKYETSAEMLVIEKKVAASITQISNLPNARRKAWSLAEDQIRYHKDFRIATIKHTEERMEKSLKIIKIGFFTSVGVKFIIEVLEFLDYKHIIYLHLYLPFHLSLHEVLHGLMPYLNVLAIVLPPIYAALEGIKYFDEWKNNISISKNIINQLKGSKDLIKACQDEQTLLKETAQLRYILEIENSEWATNYGDKELGLVM